MFTIDEIRIEGEEDGFHLIVYTDDEQSFRYRIGLPDQFHAETNRVIGRWLAEGDDARAASEADGDAHEITDTKHPDYHDTMSGIHDNREGK